LDGELDVVSPASVSLNVRDEDSVLVVVERTVHHVELSQCSEALCERKNILMIMKLKKGKNKNKIFGTDGKVDAKGGGEEKRSQEPCDKSIAPM
jgi:hypothetical protein